MNMQHAEQLAQLAKSTGKTFAELKPLSDAIEAKAYTMEYENHVSISAMLDDAKTLASQGEDLNSIIQQITAFPYPRGWTMTSIQQLVRRFGSLMADRT